MTQYVIIFSCLGLWRVSAVRSGNSSHEAVLSLQSDYQEISLISVEEYKQ